MSIISGQARQGYWAIDYERIGPTATDLRANAGRCSLELHNQFRLKDESFSCACRCGDTLFNL